jgi:hypothetical protein
LDFVIFTGTEISETPANQNIVPEEGEEKKVGTRRYTVRKAGYNLGRLKL